MDIYDQLGVKKYLNAHDTYTLYGGSRMAADVSAAMGEAAKHYVDLHELQNALGKEIAAMTKNEAAYLTSGSCAGILLAVVACLAGDDQNIFESLPQGANAKKEIIVMACQRNPFYSAITSAGATLVEIGSPDCVGTEALEQAITENTAGIVYFAEDRLAEHALPFDTIIQIAKKAKIPVIVDAASQLPPAENFYRFTQQGADMVIFSGGKGLAGPQCSGLILGSAEMIGRCKKYGFPNHGVCRASKIGKEEMVGLYVAVKNFVALDHTGNYERLMEVCRRLAAVIDDTGVMRAEIVGSGPVGQAFPMTYGHVTAGFSPCALQEMMKDVGVYIGVEGDAIFINPNDLKPTEVDIVIESLIRCVSLLKQKK